MRYGTFDLADAAGVMLAHAIRLKDQRLQKGRVLCDDDVRRLAEEGIPTVVGVRLETGDLSENQAAARIADAMERDNLRFAEAATGRVNIYAAVDGLFVADKAVVDAVNRVDPAITLACLADHVPVRAGDMVATIKIIPLAVSGVAVDEAVRQIERRVPFQVKAYRPRAVTLIATELPSLKPAVMDKTAKLLAQRLAKSGSRIVQEIRVPHARDAVSHALHDFAARGDDELSMVIIFGASAVADPDDVIPAAIHDAGGVVDHIGMPVDPGNLLILGRLGAVPVIGAPGCARSPKENGFDWILDRIMAGEEPTRHVITGMGVGGLLMEIPTRPQPREADGSEDRPLAVAAVLLAAGQARRMGAGGRHKLLAEFDGVPLVRRTAQMLLSAKLSTVVAVSGHRREEIEQAICDLDLDLVYNADYASGMASSLVAGFSHKAALAADGVLVMLADMPAVSSKQVDRLVSAFRDSDGEAIIRSVFDGKRGNPIILPRHVFPEVLRLKGDIGARAIIEGASLPVVDIDIGPAAHIDVDTPEAVLAAGGQLRD
jgi:molybdenum cofactor cytidylyltransferase